ncbi:hypothetical protein AB2N08_15440 [Massilia aurea]|uniref:hypothetical protein n=1 Tax=Massilia aurea TaxID=373040 RepID=UPI003461F7B0
MTAPAVPLQAPPSVPAPAATIVTPPPASAPAAIIPPAAPRPATPPTPARPVPVADRAPPPPANKKGGKGKWIAGGLVLLLVVFYNMSSGDKPLVEENACETAFDLGTKAVTAGDLTAARTHALRASAECGDSGRAKTDTLQRAIAAAEKTDNACLRNFRTIDGLMQDSRPGRARAGLNELTAACSNKPEAEALRNRLEATQEAVQAALAEVRTALGARDPAQARAALAKLSGLNRDEPNLGQLKGEIDALAAAIAPAAQPVQPAEVFMPGAAPVQRPLARDVERAATRAPDTGAAQRTAMASTFLRDAEQALSQRKFDAAKTYVESARRVDPDNPRLDSLMQQIRDRERQMLQEETTIR